MKIYADRPGVGMRQLLIDLFVFVWVVGWVWIAGWVYNRVLMLAVPGQKIEDAGANMSGGLSEASSKVGGVPAVGDELAAPFNRAAGAADALSEAGRAQQDAVQHLAIALVVLLLVVPLSLVLFGWLPWRLRWIRRASVAQTLRSDPTGQDLLALRAITSQPLRRLLRIHPDPASAWRRAEAGPMRALATLELRRLGLRGFS
jgi:hypothetical protein